MALIGPVLDDRTWEQLRDELVRRIPTYTREWTDHNPSDPGVALLELFASLGETLLYRFNQIPEATRIAFLRLLNVPTRPAQAASLVAVFATTDPGGVEMPRHTGLTSGDVQFETDGGLRVWPLEVLAAGRFASAPAPLGKSAAERREWGRRRDAEARMGIDDPSTVRFYETRLLPEPIDPSVTLDGALWIALRRTDDTVPGRMTGSACLHIGLEEAVTAATSFRSEELDAAPPPVLWRMWRPGDSDATDALRPLQVRDRTRGLTTSGSVELDLPGDLAAIADATAEALAADRPLGPGTDGPPDLDDDAQRESVLAWMQAVRPESAHAQHIPPVTSVEVNAVSATQLSTARQPELLGTGDGQPYQSLRLVNSDVEFGSVELDVEEAGVWQEWEQREDFVATRGPEDRHYVVDAADGAVRFPAGGQGGGRVPQLGERIRVRSYRFGGGSAGNVAPGELKADVDGVTATSPRGARGGRDAERIDDALERIPEEVHRRDRAVTADDHAALAASVAGVARAHTLPLFHPDAPGVRAAGVVSVVVLPDADAAHLNAPMPDRSLLRRVARHLDARRLITTELYVVPPEYVPIAVSVGVAVRDGYQVDAVRRWVELIVRQYLAPVPPYGPDGTGWPFGRAVVRAELAAVATQVEGVAYVEDVTLAIQRGAGWEETTRVEPAGRLLPELAAFSAVQGPPLPPGEIPAPAPAPGLPPGTVLVPLPRDVC